MTRQDHTKDGWPLTQAFTGDNYQRDQIEASKRPSPFADPAPRTSVVGSIVGWLCIALIVACIAFLAVL